MSNGRKKKSRGDSLITPGSSVGEAAIHRDDRPSDEEIRVRAYELYLARDAGGGNEVEDWLRAEREYRQRAQTRSRNDSRVSMKPGEASLDGEARDG